MPEFASKQIFIAHEGIWLRMVNWAEQHGFRLDRIPDGANEDGVPYFSDDPDVTPTYAFMPRSIG